MLNLALRNLFRHKGRTALSLAAVGFGVVSVVLSGGFIEDVFFQLKENTIHSRLGHMQVYGAGHYEFGRREPFEHMVRQPAELRARIAALPHVSEVMQRLQFSGLLNNGRRGEAPVMAEGVEPDKEARLGSAVTLIAGRALTPNDDVGVVIGEGVARALQLKVGDSVTLLVTMPEGAFNTLDFDVVGVFRTMSREYDARAVRVSLRAAQDLLGIDAVHSLVVLLDETRYTDAVLATLKSQLSSGFEVKPWYELAEFYQNAVALYRRQFTVLEIIVVVLVLLSVSSSINMVVHERTGEYGTLRALGDRRGDVFRLILAENALLGLFGAVLGVVIGVALALAISAVGIPMPPPPNMNGEYVAAVRVVPSVVGAAFVLGWAATVLAALRPAWRATRTPISEALQQNI